MSSYYHFEKNPLVLALGKFALPERPGFGIELDPAKVEGSCVTLRACLFACLLCV
jgi:hypothetical protein